MRAVAASAGLDFETAIDWAELAKYVPLDKRARVGIPADYPCLAAQD